MKIDPIKLEKYKKIKNEIENTELSTLAVIKKHGMKHGTFYLYKRKDKEGSLTDPEITIRHLKKQTYKPRKTRATAVPMGSSKCVVIVTTADDLRAILNGVM